MEKSSKNNYDLLYAAFLKAYPSKPKQQSQKEFNLKWNELKSDKANLQKNVDSLMIEYRDISLKHTGKLMSYWSTLPKQNVSTASAHPPESLPLEFLPDSDQFIEKNDDGHAIPSQSFPSASGSQIPPTKRKIYETKAQDHLKTQIDLINSDLVGLYKRRDSGFITEEQEKEIKSKKIKLHGLDLELKKKVREQERQKKSRETKRENLAKLCEKNPDLREALKLRGKTGRPTLEVDQPELLKAIVDIALHGSAAHEKRRSDVYRSIRTLDELVEELKKDFAVSRSAVYTRLLPKRSSSLEGKRHITTVPVKLIRAQNDLHSKHPDMYFCTANINRLEEIASLLGPDHVFFLSQDDKAKVPIGLTAANKQSPLIMHVEYRVSLPDHDFVIAGQHKLCPSVYAGIEIKKGGLGKPNAVTYSGPTYVAIRSCKHSTSNAYGHGFDLERLFNLDEFAAISKTKEKLVKPVVIVTVDGGPDENPRYQKVIDVAIHHFVNNNLDALFIATNAPGRSAFNRVERRMAPLSRELSGLILSPDHFGSHLDSQGRTVDEEMEKLNFEYAGQTLADIWSQVVIDNFPIVAEYVCPENSELKPDSLSSKDLNWFVEHVHTSQYLTQIVKCKNLVCCSKPRSSFFNVIPTRFLPPLFPLVQSSEGLVIPDVKDTNSIESFPSLFLALSLKFDDLLPKAAKEFKVLPFDLFCPSIQSCLKDRICKVCHVYFASQVMMKKHFVHAHTKKKNPPVEPTIQRVRPLRVAARRQRELMVVIARQENAVDAEWMDDEEVDTTGLDLIENPVLEQQSMPVISMDQHFESPWRNEEL